MFLVRIKVKPPPSLEARASKLQTDEATGRIATAMVDFWRENMRAGTMADGRGLGRNMRGGLLGIGHGTIVDGWRAVKVGRAWHSEPFQGRGVAPGQARVPVERYRIAVLMLRRRGVVYHSFSGPSGAKRSTLIKRELRRLLKDLGSK